MMKTVFLPLLLAAPLLCGCGEKNNPEPDNPQEETVVLRLADANATAETKALYSNLWAIREKGWMFGHHDDLMYGRKWYGTEGGSDTKAVCGDYPGVYSLDLSTFMDDRVSSESEENSLRLKCMKEAYDRGMVITACLHLDNPLTGGDAWDNTSTEVAAQILKDGSDTQKKFNLWLDRLATLAKGLKGSDGKNIPVIIRPFHEHTQTWSWWGSRCTSEQQFIALWRYFVDYLKSAGVHVDFIGMDCYQGINNTIFVNNLKVLSKLSIDRKKPAGVTETGVEGFKNPDYWIENIAAPMAGRKMSLLVTWRNKYDPMEQGSHYFSVFPGHVSVESFKTLYDRPDTYFCKDLPRMYVPAANITVQ